MSGKRPAYRTVPHGDRECNAKARFWCVMCHRLACWCTGCADQVDAFIAALYRAPVPTGDPGVCDECHSALAMASGHQHAVQVVVAQEPAVLVLPFGCAPGFQEVSLP